MHGIGQVVREKREALGWTQAKLAVEAGMAVSGVNQIELGKRTPNAATLEKLAGALGAEVRDLFPLAQAPLLDLDATTGGSGERREKDERLAAALMADLAEQGEDLEEELKVSFSEGFPLGWAYSYGNNYLALELAYRTLDRERPVQRETREAWEELEKVFSRVNALLAPHFGDVSAGDMRSLAAFSKKRAESRRLREPDDEASDANAADVS